MAYAIINKEEAVGIDDEDLILCAVCLLPFDDAKHKPKYLDCHHYFCIKCIQVNRYFGKSNNK